MLEYFKWCQQSRHTQTGSRSCHKCHSLKLSWTFEKYWDHLNILGHCLCTNGSILKQKGKTACVRCFRDGRHINLVRCHIGVSFTFLLKIIYSFYLYCIPRLAIYYIRYLQNIQHLLNLIWRKMFGHMGNVYEVDRSPNITVNYFFSEWNMDLIGTLGSVVSFEWFMSLHSKLGIFCLCPLSLSKKTTPTQPNCLICC